MFCKYCGKELPDGSNFCKHCGKKLVDEVETQPTENVTQTPAPAAAQAVSSTPISDTVKNAMQDGKKKKVIIGVIVAAVVIIASLVCISMFSSSVPKSLIEDSIRESSSFNKGFVSTDYTNASNYTLSDVEITGSEKVDNSLQLAWYGGNDGKTVYFKGKLKNDSFESEFSGKATFIKDSNGWRIAGSASKTSSTTKPLKGVDKFDLSNSSSSSYSYSSSNSDVTTSSDNFKSELKNNNGSYTCEASQNYKIEYWFGNDTASVKQNFKFNPEKGWEKQGDQTISNQKSSYSLAGKSFEYVDSTTVSGMSDKITLNFTTSEENNVVADYVIDHTADKAANSNNNSVNLSGTAKGTSIKHTFGESSFKVDLNDEGQSVTFNCMSSNKKQVAGVGEMNTLYASLSTNAVSYQWRSYSSNYTKSGFTFVETKKTTT